MSESLIQAKILLEASRLGSRLFRNNKGKFLTLDSQRIVAAGLMAEGSSDLVGWTPVEITQEMVGKILAVFTACEVKAKLPKNPEKYGRPDQRNFINQVNNAGGIGFFCDDKNNLKYLLRWQKKDNNIMS